MILFIIVIINTFPNIMSSTNISVTEQRLLHEIREYTYNNKELLKNAHHFMFACPVKKNGKPADIIICGLNPGQDPKKDYRKIFNGELFPTEESSDYDWWVEDNIKNIRGEGKFSKYNEIFGKEKNITHTEAFFWNSTSIEPEHFDARYGYSFYDNPHWDFCLRMNNELIKAHNPNFVLFLTSAKEKVAKIAKIFNLKEIYSFELPKGKRWATKMYHYELGGYTPVIFMPHPTGYNPSSEQMEAMRQYLKRIGLV